MKRAVAANEDRRRERMTGKSELWCSGVGGEEEGEKEAKGELRRRR